MDYDFGITQKLRQDALQHVFWFTTPVLQLPSGRYWRFSAGKVDMLHRLSLNFDYVMPTAMLIGPY